MRAFIWGLFFLLLLSTGASAANQVNFVGELPVKGLIAVASDQDGRLYIPQESGTILVVDQNMSLLHTIGSGDRQWRREVLHSPAGISVYNNHIYVADVRSDRLAVLTTDGDLISHYGESGKNPGQLKNPSDVFVYKGVIYVADTGNNRIQVFGENGVFLNAFGHSANAGAPLNRPVRVAVGNNGHIYVLDNSGTISIFNAAGTFLGILSGNTDISTFCVDETGVLVADGKQFSIKKYDFGGNLTLSFGSEGMGRAQFKDISALVVNSRGVIFAGDARRNLIQAFAPERRLISGIIFRPAAPPTSASRKKSIPTESKRSITRMVRNGDLIYAVSEGSNDILTVGDGISTAFTVEKIHPEALAFDSRGAAYVMEKQKVFRLKPRGEVDFSFGTSERSRRYQPGDMVISDTGLVYVSDRQTPAIKVYNTDGIFIRAFEKYGEIPIQDPVALAIDEDGLLYVLDAGLRMLVIFSGDGRLLHRFTVGDDGADLVDLAVVEDHAYILDARGGYVDLFTASGRHRARFAASGDAPGFLSGPSAIVAGADSDFWVAEIKSRRLQKFRVSYSPDPPPDFEATGGPRQVRLQWAPPDAAGPAGIDAYDVYRADSDFGKVEKLATTTGSTFVDRSAEPGVTALYWVTARARYGNESSPSLPVAAAAAMLAVPPPANLSAVPGDISVTLTWEAHSQGDMADHLDRYIVYRNEEVVDATVENTYLVEELVPETSYLFQISSVSTDGVESEKAALSVSTQATTRPPVEIEVHQLTDIFSNTYKYYEDNGIGSIVVRNNTHENISRLTVLFTIKNFMDFATETAIRDLAPGKSREILLKAVFNDQILNVTEDTPVQTEITASYYLRGEPRTYATKQTINVYEKHKMRWDDSLRLGAFITPRDPVIMEFVRSVVIQYRHTTDPLISAGVIFNALGTAGLTYVIDPSSAYQETRHNTDLIDYLQYPRDTIRRKSGDCDDLVILYVAALESVGIRTRFLEVPGHILMMFAIGHTDSLGPDTMNDMLIVDDAGTVWVPVETTRVGQPFTAAWEAGSRNYHRCHPDERSAVDLRQAWEKYKPASLPQADFSAPGITREEIEMRFKNEYDVIRRTSVAIRNHDYVVRVEKDPDDIDARLQLGIAYARFGVLDTAQRMFENALEKSPDNAALLNNIANIFYLDQQFEKAVGVYQRAVESEPTDPLIRINLVQTLLSAGRPQEAKKVFDEACGIDPDLPGRFRSLAMRLPGSE